MRWGGEGSLICQFGNDFFSKPTDYFDRLFLLFWCKYRSISSIKNVLIFLLKSPSPPPSQHSVGWPTYILRQMGTSTVRAARVGCVPGGTPAARRLAPRWLMSLSSLIYKLSSVCLISPRSSITYLYPLYCTPYLGLRLGFTKS